MLKTHQRRNDLPLRRQRLGKVGTAAGRIDENPPQLAAHRRVGAYEQSASFYTNDPLKPKFTINISGKITATLRILPATLILSRISANETTQGSVTVLSYLDQPLEIKSHRFEDDAEQQVFRPRSNSPFGRGVERACGGEKRLSFDGDHKTGIASRDISADESCWKPIIPTNRNA